MEKYWPFKEVMKSIDLGKTLKRKPIESTEIREMYTPMPYLWVRNMGTDEISKKKTCQMSKGQWRGACQVKKRKIETGTSISVPKQKKNDILKIIEQKWRWIEHMMRDTRDKWSQAVTEWGPRDEKRNRGRQLTMWEDETKLSADPNWRRVARDRKH